MKRKLMLLLSAAMIIGISTTSIAAVSFSDINNVPWEGAKTYINDVAGLGLMVGDQNSAGKTVFRAKDKVTYCETTQMAYNLLKKANKLKSSTGVVEKWTAVMKGYKIPTWAYESVSYALDNNIVSVADISRFMKAETTNNYASREDVAVIFGKALSSINPANTAASLSFNDKSKIAATSVPYVDLLVRMNIIVGDSSNNFNPRNYINRAEMAVIASKTNTALGGSTTTPTPNPTPTPTPNPTPNPDTPTATTEVRGTLVKVDDMGGSAMISVSVNGINSGFIVDSTTYIVYADRQVSYTALSAGDNVTVNYTGAKINKLTINFSMNNGIGSTGVKGKIDDITNEKIFINKDSGGTANYYFANNLTITINKDNSTVKQLIETFDESSVDVELSLNGKSEVTTITATTDKSEGVTGEIVSIDSDEVEIRRTNGGRTTYKFTSDPIIKFDGSTSTTSKINSKMDDDTIYGRVYLTSGGKVEKLESSYDKYSSSSSSSDTIKGEISSIDDDYIKVIKDGSSRSTEYELKSSATLRFDGSSSTIRELSREADDDTVYVAITLDSSDRVTRVDASTKKSSSSSTRKSGTMTYLSEDKIKVKGSTYYMADDVDYTLEDDDSTYSKVERAFENNDEELYVTFKLDSDGDVTLLEASKRSNGSSSSSDDTYEGIITEVSSSYIKLDNKTTKYTAEDDIEDDVKISITDGDNKITDYTDLERAMDNEKEMEVEITIEDDNLVKIEGEVTEAIGRVANITSSDKTIRIELPVRSSSTYEYKSSVNVKIDGSSKEISDLIDKYKSKDYDVVLTLSNGYVTDIKATSR